MMVVMPAMATSTFVMVMMVVGRVGMIVVVMAIFVLHGYF